MNTDKLTQKKVAAFPLARDESRIAEGVTTNLLVWGTVTLNKCEASPHDGDCTNKSYSCARCDYERVMRDAKALIEFAGQDEKASI